MKHPYQIVSESLGKKVILTTHPFFGEIIGIYLNYQKKVNVDYYYCWIDPRKLVNQQFLPCYKKFVNVQVLFFNIPLSMLDRCEKIFKEHLQKDPKIIRQQIDSEMIKLCEQKLKSKYEPSKISFGMISFGKQKDKNEIDITLDIIYEDSPFPITAWLHNKKLTKLTITEH